MPWFPGGAAEVNTYPAPFGPLSQQGLLAFWPCQFPTRAGISAFGRCKGWEMYVALPFWPFSSEGTFGPFGCVSCPPARAGSFSPFGRCKRLEPFGCVLLGPFGQVVPPPEWVTVLRWRVLFPALRGRSGLPGEPDVLRGVQVVGVIEEELSMC